MCRLQFHNHSNVYVLYLLIAFPCFGIYVEHPFFVFSSQCQTSVEGMCINLECPIGCGAELPRYDVTFDLRVILSDHTGSLDNIRLSGATAERVIGCTVRRSVTLLTILYTYIKLK